MKSKRNMKAGEDRAVSAVIGVILMVAITVAIAATVYVYASGMVSSLSSTTTKVIPELSFVQSGDTLIVQKCPSGLTWADITVSGGTAPTGTETVDVGDTITGCSGTVIVAYNGELVGTYTF